MPVAATTRFEPEFRLLVEASRAACDPDRIGHVRMLSTACQADRVAQLADRHRIQAFTHAAIVEAGGCAEALDGEVLRESSRRARLQNLQSAAAVAELAGVATTISLDMLLVKGLATAALAFRNPMQKTCRDIDILVAPEAIDPAAAMLRELAFRPLCPESRHAEWHRVHKESVWLRPDGLVLELHSRLANNSHLIPQIGMSSARQSVTIARVVVETLAPDELIAYSAVHGASSLWFRLKWLADFAGLLWHKHGPNEADESWQRSLELGAGRSADLAFLLANRVMGVRLSDALVKQLAKDPLTMQLVATDRKSVV